MIYGIVPAAGSGTRMRLDAAGPSKQYLPFGTGTVLTTTLKALWQPGLLAGLIVVVPEADVGEVTRGLQALPFSVSLQVVAGGATRQESVRRGLEAVPEAAEYVVVHDAVRPLVTKQIIERVVEAARRFGAATAGLPVADTVKRADGDGVIVETVDRTGLWSIQTPQAFRADWLREAHRRAAERGAQFTDDAGMVEALGRPVRVVEGDPRNIKLTRPDDLRLARVWQREAEGETATLRVGIGYDVHRLVEGKPLILGGVPVPHTHGLLGHSDADVLAHAVTDALLGAVALGDIGQHFPDTDPKYKGADSIELLKAVVDLLAQHGWHPVQMDAVIAAQKPKLAPYVPAMREQLAAALRLNVEAVSVKATTTEGLGFVGREEGIEVRCVVTVRGDRAG